MFKKLAFLFAILFCGLIHAEVVDKTAQIESITDFSGGMNTHVNSIKLNNEYSPFISNWYVDEEIGTLVKTKGFQILGSTDGMSSTNGITLFRIFKRESEQDEFILSDNLKVLSTRDFVSYTLLKDGLSEAASNLSCIQVYDKLWFSNGLDPVFTYNGSTVIVLNGSVQGGVLRPNVPRGKYLAFYQERVWVANSTDSVSSLDWSSLVSTDVVPIAINPDSALAWPPTNRLFISRGDGFPISSIFTFNSQLFIGKEPYIFVIAGNNSLNYSPQKVASDVGPISNDSVTYGDNLVYFKAKNSICAFDGNNSRRLTDAISEEMENVENEVVQDGQLVWDTAAQFDRGGNYFGLDTTSDGSVRAAVTGYVRINQIATSEASISSARQDVSSQTATIFYSTVTTVDTIPSRFIGYVARSLVWVKNNVGGSGQLVRYRNNRTNEVGNNQSFLSGVGAYEKAEWANGFSNGITVFSPLYTGDDINNNRLSVQYSVAANDTLQFTIHFASMSNTTEIYLTNRPNNAYFSEIATISVLTEWNRFDADYETNGGDVDFFIKTASSINSLIEMPFTAISPGSIIDSPSTHTFVQWATSMTSVGDQPNPGHPVLQRVLISYKTGGLDQNRPISVFHNDRLWVSVATQTNSQMRVIYVKSKVTNKNPDAWVRLDGIHANSFLLTGGLLYGGSSTSATSVLLDSGFNFNGSSINAVYQTPNFLLGDPIYKKQIVKYIYDAFPLSGGILGVTTIFNGSSYASSTHTLTGTNRVVGEINKPINTYVKTLGTKLTNESVSGPVKINAFHIIYKPTEVFQ